MNFARQAYVNPDQTGSLVRHNLAGNPNHLEVSMFGLSQRSLHRLSGVHPDLIAVVARAIKITTVDFAVLEGIRSESRQKELVKAGASQTMNSRHLTGHAVELGAWVDGTIRWDWPLYYKIAEAVKQAADELNKEVQWGAAWGRNLSDFPTADAASEDYVNEKREKGERPFLDGPHFQINR